MVELASLAVDGYLNAVAWNPSGSRLAALSGFGNQLTIWDATTWKRVHSFPRYGGAYSGNSLAWLADGSLLLPAPKGRSPDPPFRELYLTSFEQIDPKSGKRIRYVEDKFFDRGRRRIMEIFSVAQGAIVAGIPTGNPAMISLFDATPWKLKMNFDVTEGDPRYGFARGVALSNDGAQLAVGTADGRLRTYDTASGEPLCERELTRPPLAIGAVAFSRDGRWLAIGRSRGYVAGGEREPMLRILETATLEDAVEPVAALDDIYALSWGPTDEVAVAASNAMMVGRIGADGTLVPLAAEAARDVYSVAFSPAGHLAAARGSTVVVYEV